MKEDPEAAGLLDALQCSPLVHAVRGGDLQIVQLLLDHGANPNAPEHESWDGAALFTAAVLDRREIADLLLARGANPNPGVDSSGHAIDFARENITRSLLKAGALDHIPWTWTGGHPSAEERLTTALRERNPVIYDEVEYQYEGGWGTFVHCIIDCGNVEILDLHVEIVGTDKLYEFGSFHCRFADPLFLERLIAHGFSPDNRDWWGRTNLHHAALNGKLDMVECLLNHGANIEAVDLRERTTPLGYAARKGHPDMVRYLLSRRASLEPPEGREWATPQALAELEGRAEVLEILQQARP